MARDDRPATDAMIDACLRIHEMARESGSPEMIIMSRLLLYQAGRKIADEMNAEEDGEHHTEH